MAKENNINIKINVDNVNVSNGGVFNLASENAKIESKQENIVKGDELKNLDAQNNNKFREKKEEIDDLLNVKEYERAFDILKELKKCACGDDEVFWVKFLYGKYYLLVYHQEGKNNRIYLDNAESFFEEAVKYMLDGADDVYEDCHRYILNTYIMKGKEYEDVKWYEKGIQYFEKYINELVACDKKGNRRYATTLDYALLLVESSCFYQEKKAREKLELAFSIYKLIYDIEVSDRNKIDTETIYRYYINAGRCCLLLAEYDGYKEYYDYALEFYEQLLETGLISLREPERYGMLYNNMGNVYALQFTQKSNDIDKIKKAKDCYEKAARAYKNMDDKRNYYECLSNLARARVSLYDLTGGAEGFEEIEQLLNEIIENRFKLENSKGAYTSKVQLAQLYVKYAKKNNDVKRAEEAVCLFQEVLDFFSNDYILDNYYKIYCGLFNAKSLLNTLKIDYNMLEVDIKSLLTFLEKELMNMSLYIKELFVQQIVENFFLYISNVNQDEQEKMYNLIESAFFRMKIDINEYIETI